MLYDDFFMGREYGVVIDLLWGASRSCLVNIQSNQRTITQTTLCRKMQRIAQKLSETW